VGKTKVALSPAHPGATPHITVSIDGMAQEGETLSALVTRGAGH